MRILINKPIVISSLFDDFELSNLKQELEDYTKLCNSLGVVFTYTINLTDYTAVIHTQKIVLEELVINNFLNETAWLVNFNLEYLPRGKGCDLTLEMTQCEL